MSIPVPEKRISDFEKLGFGMFIHWGLYSQLGEGEWIMHLKNIPKEEYSKLKDTFTAKDFDAEKIAFTAKNSGMKYITLTTRHHEGFSLYDTKGLSDYDAPHSPAGRDLVAEFIAACRKYGLVPMLYHTTLDWYDDRFETNFNAYLEYLRNSVEILCTEYGEIGGLWFDGNWSKPDADWQEDKLYSMIRRLQPNAMIINNTGLTARGEIGNLYLDSVTFEQGRPEPMNRDGMKKYVAAEMCQTINDHWGYGKADLNSKSVRELIENLCACRKIGANYLLNVGPTPDGAITKLHEAILEEIGKWIKISGESIYLGRPTYIKGTGKDFALEYGNKIYFYIHNLGSVAAEQVVNGYDIQSGNRIFTGVDKKIKSVRYADCDEELSFSQTEDGRIEIDCTGYPYGKSLVVRIAEAEF